MILKVSASPHVRDGDTTSSIMRDVAIALLPAMLVAFITFGFRAIFLTLVTVGASVFFEYVSQRLMKRPQTIQDWSAVVTGILLAFNLPPTFPLWMAVLGAFLAIVLVKQAFGGLGDNFVNPALAARAILTVSFPAQMTDFAVKQSFLGESIFASYDLTSSATTLGLLKTGGELPSFWQQFVGFKAGTIGEISILALLLGGAYMLHRGIIKWTIPLSFIGTTLLFVGLAGQNPLHHLLSGGLMLGAIFMATDYVTNPINRTGKLIFGIGCGLITGMIRIYGASTEGVSFAILIMNILTPHIDHVTNAFPRGRRARLKFPKKGAAREKEA